MAPIIGLKRTELIALLRKPNVVKALPIRINWMGPAGEVQVDNGMWQLRSLRCNTEASEAERQRRVAEGDDQWQPEHTWPFYEPDEIILEAGSKETFIEKVEAMDWPFTPDDFGDERQAGANPLTDAVRRLIDS